MFLAVDGVTGEAQDEGHKGEIDVVSWSWGMQATTDVATGAAAGRAKLSELHVVKRVDQSSPTLMSFLKNNKLAKTAKLTVRKAGGAEPLEYFTIELFNARITTDSTTARYSCVPGSVIFTWLSRPSARAC